VATAGVTDVARSAVTHQAKILLVDDRAENLLALEAILSSLDQELVFARSGEAAVEAALANDFAVILLDVVMPGMDGFETAAQIKERGRAQDVPIIFLTAAGADPELAFRGYAAGAVDYISKPFDPWVLRAKVAFFVELYRKDQALQNATRGLDEVGALLAGLEAELRRGGLEPDEVLARVTAAARRSRGAAGRGPVAPVVPPAVPQG